MTQIGLVTDEWMDLSFPMWDVVIFMIKSDKIAINILEGQSSLVWWFIFNCTNLETLISLYR